MTTEVPCLRVGPGFSLVEILVMFPTSRFVPAHEAPDQLAEAPYEVGPRPRIPSLTARTSCEHLMQSAHPRAGLRAK